MNAEAKRTLRRRARGRVAQGKHRKIPKAQANRRPDPESLPTATARSALGVSDPEDVRESALLTQDFAAGVGGRRAAAGVRRCGREREKAKRRNAALFKKKMRGKAAQLEPFITSSFQPLVLLLHQSQPVPKPMT